MNVFYKSLLLSFTIVLSNQNGRAQNIHEIAIQEISIKDTLLMNEITKMVSEQENADRENVSKWWFQKGFGYIKLIVDPYSKGDTLLRYQIMPDQSPINASAPDSDFPNYYALNNARPILVYYSHSIMAALGIKFSRKSKVKFLNQLDKVLPKPEKEIGRNKKGEEVFRIDDFRPQHITFGMNKTIYLLRDSSYVISKERDY